jgi:hypothetical protein
MSKIEHLIVDVDSKGIALLELKNLLWRPPHNYPQKGSLIVFKEIVYEVVLIVHNYDTRQVQYYVKENKSVILKNNTPKFAS